MSKFQAIFFDLDGTLWDPTAPLLDLYNTVQEKLSLAEKVDAPKIAGTLGKTKTEFLESLFPDASSERRNEIDRCLAEHFPAAMDRTAPRLFPGVAEGLPLLDARYDLFIVSNCECGYIERFLSWSGLGRHFLDHECWGNTGQSKGENLRSLLRRYDIQSALMVGDTSGDEEAARFCSVPFAWMGYGFGRVQQPDHIFDDFSALVRFLS